MNCQDSMMSETASSKSKSRGSHLRRVGKSVLHNPCFHLREYSTINKLLHSIFPDAMLLPQNGSDEDVLPGAPPQANGEMMEVDNDASEEVHAGDGGMSKQNVKIEDLFNDEDSDDGEFPSSSISNVKNESSPPAAPM